MCMKRRSSRIKYLIPTDDPELVRPGFLYIRRTSKGKEFVRNRRTTDDNMCPNCRRQSTRATALGQQEADIDARIAQLEAELKTTQEREQQERVGFRRPQPYQYTQAEETQSTPPPKIIDATPSPTSGRRVSFDPEPRIAYYRPRRQHQQHNHQRRPSHCTRQYAYEDREPSYSSDDIEYQTYDEYPPTAYRSCGRRSSHRASRQYRYHDGIPLLFQRIITGGRRRRSNAGCRRASRPYVVQYPQWQYESRSPEDYWY